MIGPTGVGKTEISRRLAQLARPLSSRSKRPSSPRSAMSAATSNRSSATSSRSASRWCATPSARTSRPRRTKAEDRVLDALVGAAPVLHARDLPPRLRDGELNDKDIEIQIADAGAGMPSFDIPGMPGARRHDQSRRHAGQGAGRRTKPRRMTVATPACLIAEESDKLIDNDAIVQDAIQRREQRHRLPRRDRQDLGAQRRARRRRRAAAKAFSAISCR